MPSTRFTSVCNILWTSLKIFAVALSPESNDNMVLLNDYPKYSWSTLPLGRWVSGVSDPPLNNNLSSLGVIVDSHYWKHYPWIFNERVMKVKAITWNHHENLHRGIFTVWYRNMNYPWNIHENKFTYWKGNENVFIINKIILMPWNVPHFIFRRTFTYE